MNSLWLIVLKCLTALSQFSFYGSEFYVSWMLPNRKEFKNILGIEIINQQVNFTSFTSIMKSYLVNEFIWCFLLSSIFNNLCCIYRIILISKTSTMLQGANSPMFILCCRIVNSPILPPKLRYRWILIFFSNHMYYIQLIEKKKKYSNNFENRM